jgi:RNA polymerase sigma factor (sigma-70 family)
MSGAARGVDERQILRKALEGDRQATEGLVRYLEPVLRGQVLGVLRAFGCARRGDLRQELDELIQHAWTVILKDDQRVLRRWEPERAALTTYVGRVVRLRTLGRLEVKRTNPWTDTPMAPEDLPLSSTQADSPERTAADRQLLEHVLTQLHEELTPRGRVLFDLIIVQQLSNGRIRELTGKSTGTINNRRAAFRRRLVEIRDQIS